MKSLSDLEKRLNLKFTDQGLLTQAFTHRSFLNEQSDKKLSSNERLEFLGDSILSIVVTRYFYEKFESATEGTLTTLRAQAVQTRTLAMAAKELSLGEYLLLSKGEERSGGRQNESLLADTFEALIGAIYLDQGFSTTSQFIDNYLLKKQGSFNSFQDLNDYKSNLQRQIQDKLHVSPTYKTISEIGPDHAKKFKVAVLANNKRLGEGWGKNKQQAQQQAAKQALETSKLK